MGHLILMHYNLISFFFFLKKGEDEPCCHLYARTKDQWCMQGMEWVDWKVFGEHKCWPMPLACHLHHVLLLKLLPISHHWARWYPCCTLQIGPCTCSQHLSSDCVKIHVFPMCEWSNPWHMLIVFARHALFLIHVAYCILFITFWQPCNMAENQIKFAPQPFKRVHPHITIPHCEPTSSLMSSRAQSALAGLNGSDVKDSPNNLISASSRTTGHAVDIGCLCTSYCLMWCIFSDYFSCFLSRLIRWFVAFVLHCFSCLLCL